GAAFAALGRWGEHFSALSIALFAFATLTGWSFYGEQGARYLLGEKSVKPYRVVYLAAVAAGCAMRLETVWAAADVLNGLMAVPNLIGVVALSGQAIRELRRWERTAIPSA
ncbi:MAG: alanine:cation symporter family protein, partial [Firmicutes bacterium]|nr:alanine:cation symporter family protein [Bacillota bacterium]